MSSRKNYNSLVFLTTLSVYLGLVLVGGATPSVLAQAATTRDFNIKNEIVVEDDLDKKPDDEELVDFAKSLQNYFEDTEKFVKDLQKLHGIDKIDLDINTFEYSVSKLLPCVDGNKVGPATVTYLAANKWLRPAIEDFGQQLGDYYYLADCQLNKRVKNKKVTDSSFRIKFDGNAVDIEISAKKDSSQEALHLVEEFHQAYRLYEVEEDEVIVKKIYENTSFKSENNQVFIVTRLPRSSIDDLLAEKDAR
jgi:hypothetical protein